MTNDSNEQQAEASKQTESSVSGMSRADFIKKLLEKSVAAGTLAAAANLLESRRLAAYANPVSNVVT